MAAKKKSASRLSASTLSESIPAAIPSAPASAPDSTGNSYAKRWAVVLRVAGEKKAPAAPDIGDVLAWGRSLDAMSDATLDANLGEAVSTPHVGNAFTAMLRAGAAREVIAVAQQLYAARLRRGSSATFSSAFVSQLFAAATFVDEYIRADVLSWALDLDCEPDAAVFFNKACALAKSGHRQHAFENIRLARKAGVFAHVFQRDADFATLKDDPDFERALNPD